MTVRSRRSLILPNAIRRSMAYLRSNGVQVIPGASTASGGYYRAPVLDALTYDPNTYEMLGVKSGIGGLTIARGSERYVLNSDGLYSSVAAYAAAWNGGRDVQNLASLSEAPETQEFTVVDGGTYILSGTGVFDWGVTGPGVSFSAIGGIPGQRKAWPVSPTAGGTITVTVNTAGENIQFEDSTGRADLTTPSEYCPTGRVVGGEQILNGGFDTDTDWLLGGSWVISGGTASATGTGNNMGSNALVVPGTTYKIEFEVLSGAISGLYFGTGTAANVVISTAGFFPGTHVVYTQAAPDLPNITFRANVCEMDNVSVHEVTNGYKVFANENGNSVIDNVVAEGVGAALPVVPWLSACPAASNALVYSRDMTNSAWVKTNAINTYDQVGLTGAPNTASVLGDDSGGGSGGVLIDENVIVVVSGQQNCFVVYAKKKQLSWIRLGTRNFDAPSYETYFDLDNVVIGATDTFPSSAIMTTNDGWIKCIVQFSSTTDVSGTLRINIADGDNDASVDRDGTSDVYIGNVEFYLNRTIAEVRGLPPIFTEGTEVSVQGDGPSFDIANHNNDEVCYYFEWSPGYAYDEKGTHESIIKTVAGAFSICYDHVDAGELYTYDGVNGASVAGVNHQEGDSIKIGVIASISDGLMQISANGVWGDVTAYKGYAVNAALQVMASNYSMRMRDFQRYAISGNEDQKAKIDELMN